MVSAFPSILLTLLSPLSPCPLSSLCLSLSPANYMDNWKCTAILRGDGSPVDGSSSRAAVPSTAGGPQHVLLKASSAGRKKAQLMPG
uniref:Secreted protein n=1 Tax=Hucho hucho TaxID=62062 RepID=A0A4W5LI02_9TELE